MPPRLFHTLARALRPRLQAFYSTRTYRWLRAADDWAYNLACREPEGTLFLALGVLGVAHVALSVAKKPDNRGRTEGACSVPEETEEPRHYIMSRLRQVRHCARMFIYNFFRTDLPPPDTIFKWPRESEGFRSASPWFAVLGASAFVIFPGLLYARKVSQDKFTTLEKRIEARAKDGDFVPDDTTSERLFPFERHPFDTTPSVHKTPFVMVLPVYKLSRGGDDPPRGDD
ncbi:uncharacterized protein LOC62_02G003470 [Vanrija pseudolonga]|uniref:Uncharacterized protein n=1 Tax=Vanrija pseudolonga TaxID=143232 RepID=A0AAF0Y8N4_9TREE|nr:hypothetical protein LOC62_02G003470 [Vanrija pseudolonga]